MLYYGELSCPCPPTPSAGLGHKVLEERNTGLHFNKTPFSSTPLFSLHLSRLQSCHQGQVCVCGRGCVNEFVCCKMASVTCSATKIKAISYFPCRHFSSDSGGFTPKNLNAQICTSHVLFNHLKRLLKFYLTLIPLFMFFLFLPSSF